MPKPNKNNVEKPKDFKKTFNKLLKSLKPYYVHIIVITILSILGTVFTIVGPKILGNATTELYNGIVSKIQGLGGINFSKLHKILLTILILYIVSAVFNYLEGIIMANISQKFAKDLRTKVDKKVNKILFKISSGVLTLTSPESEIGTADEEIPCRYDGDEIIIALNSNYVSEPLKNIKSEEVVFEFTEAMRAVTIRPEPAEDYFHIVMPMNNGN